MGIMYSSKKEYICGMGSNSNNKKQPIYHEYETKSDAFMEEHQKRVKNIFRD